MDTWEYFFFLSVDADIGGMFSESLIFTVSLEEWNLFGNRVTL